MKRAPVILAVLFAVVFARPPASYAQIILEGSLTHDNEANLGGTYSGNIVVRNPDKAPHAVRVYQTDYFFYADGRAVYGEVGTVDRSNAAWIDYFPKHFTIPAGDTVLVNYTVSVPGRASLAGTYWSMLMVEGIPDDSPEAGEGGDTPDVAVGVRELFRFGVQMVTHIGETGVRRLKIIGAKLVKTEAEQGLQLDVTNTGERWLRPALRVELYNIQGAQAGSYEGGMLRIYPGTSVRYRVDLSDVPPGTYKALVVLDSGGDDVYGANYTLRFKE